MGKSPRWLLFACISITAQLLAFVAVLSAAPGASVPVSAFIWQVLSALCAGACLIGQANPFRSRCAGFIFAFCLCLFLPVAGQFMVFCTVLRKLQWASTTDALPMEFVDAVSFDETLLARINYGVGGTASSASELVERYALAEALTDGTALPATCSNSLHSWLEHPDDEIRLLAYGVRSTAENTLVQAISETREYLETAGSPELRGRLHWLLAQLHWQLLTRGLVQEEMREQEISRVEKHIRLALADHPEWSACWYVLGQCALLRHHAATAETCFLNAARMQFPDSVLQLARAEAAFLMADYERTAAILRQRKLHVNAFSHKHVVEYWD